MPHKSLREIRAELSHRRSNERDVDALLVIQGPDGKELHRAGGRWSPRLRCYLPGVEVKPHVVRLQESQERDTDGSPGVVYSFLRWIEAVRIGDKNRIRLLMAGGNRGSGKTFFLGGLAIVVIALEWPGDWQFGVNINSDNRRECINEIEKCSALGWIKRRSEDVRDPFLEFVTGSRVQWFSAQNPRKLRQAGLRIRHILLNEGQEMAEVIFNNAIGGIRNLGGLLSIATNPPQTGRADWVATYWNAALAGELGHRAAVHHLNNKLNKAVDRAALDDIAVLLRAGNQEAAEADADGVMKLSGPTAYKNFVALPFARGGHIADPPPQPMVGRPAWRDVTRERTAAAMNGGKGFDWLIGADFQRRPGIVGIGVKLFEVVLEHPDFPGLKPGTLVIWAGVQINCPGDESAWCDSLERAGFTPQGFTGDEKAAPSALVIGDGTGAKQNGQHRWDLPTSFVSIRQEGWSILPPRWTRKKKADNPTVRESRSQMWDLFNARAELQREGAPQPAAIALVSPKLKASEGGFVGLIPALRLAKVNPSSGSLVGGYHHPPDGFRYVCWWAGPKPEPPKIGAPDSGFADELRAIRILTSE